MVHMDDLEVETPHSFTGRMCAGSRYEEHTRKDRLFTDPQAFALAGSSGRRQPMGAWILVPRTKFGDDLLVERYHNHGARQLVLLGAGMDSRAFRLPGLPELKVFEVDQQTTFDVKEPILKALRDEKTTTTGEGPEGQSSPQNNGELLVRSRHTVATDFSVPGQWVEQLTGEHGFDVKVPTVWLLEGLMMYLSPKDGQKLMQDIGRLSAPKSVVFHDGCSKQYITEGIAVAGAPFIGGSDDYAQEWKTNGGFAECQVHDFSADIKVDRSRRSLLLKSPQKGRATPDRCRGNLMVLFVVAEK
eukprot:g6132.t1